MYLKASQREKPIRKLQQLEEEELKDMKNFNIFQSDLSNKDDTK